MNEENSSLGVQSQAFSFNISERFRGYLPIVVDVETAGLDPKENALLEIALMTVVPDEKGFLHPGTLMSSCIRPFKDSVICDENIAFLGIDPFDESRNLRNEEEVLPEFFKFVKKEIKAYGCKRAVLVGHNGSFDLGFVQAAAARIGWAKKCPFHPFSVMDTASLSFLVYGQSVLAKACRAAGIEFEASKAHTAAYDTTKECELFCKLYNSFTTFAGIPDPHAAD